MKKTGLILLLLLVFSTSIFGQDRDEIYKKGLEYLQNGDYTNAITEFSDVIKRYDDTNAYWFRGNSYVKIEKFDEAIADYNIYIQRKPDFASSYVIRGNTYRKIKKFDEAIADYDIVIRYEPDLAYVYIYRGYAYGAKGIYSQASKDYRQGLEKGYDISGFRVNKSDKSDMWLCVTICKDIAVNKFLGNSTAVSKNEAWLKTICDNNGLSRAEIDNYFRDSMRAEVKTVVDEEFNKISFMVKGYNARLTYIPQTGGYILGYGGSNADNNTITASNLTALASEMRKKSFDDTAINLVREQASQTPAAVYAQRHARGEANALELIIESVTNFFVNPSQNNYNTLLGIDARYSSGYSSAQTKASLAYSTALNRIWDGFGRRIAEEVNKDRGSNIHTYARYPNDPRYAVFGGR